MEPASDDWYVEERPDLWIVRARILDRVPTVGHAFSTRRAVDAVDGFDLGPARGATADVLARRRALCRAAGLGAVEPLVLEQEHGARPIEAHAGQAAEAGRGDALYAPSVGRAGPVLSVRTADCAPLLVVDAEGQAFGAIHAGWRGAAAGIVGATLAELARHGVAPSRLLVAIGPAIGPCCYEVGPEVVRAVAQGTRVSEERIRARTRTNGPALDLPRALGLQLAAAGVTESRLSRAPWCTACRADLFFSHRRDGAPTGRMMAVIGRREAVP